MGAAADVRSNTHVRAITHVRSITDVGTITDGWRWGQAPLLEIPRQVGW